MTIVGFDVSKDSLVGVRINKAAHLQESFDVKNDSESITEFFDNLCRHHPKILVASEATAEYHRPLALECLRRNIPFRLLNPILTKQFTRATVRKRKTDFSDALIIAKLALQGEGSLVDESSFNSLKTIIRTATKLTRMAQMMNLMHSRIKQIMPEEKWIQDELGTQKDTLQNSIKKLRRHVANTSDSRVMKLLCSIPGIGPTVASTLIVEIGDIERFPSGKMLAAYAGLDPKVRQSGNTLKRNTRLTKRGSPYLRRVIYLAASIAVMRDPELKKYFEKKINEGKRYKEATVATARKILYRVHAVWKRGTPYVRYPQPDA